MTLLTAQGLGHYYDVGGLLTGRRRLQVLQGLDIQLLEGESVGLLGCSGSGKSTLARLLLGLEKPRAGAVRFHGQAQDFLRTVQMVFQDAPSAFNPQRSIGWSIAEPLRHLLHMDAAACRVRVAQLLEQVGLDGADAVKLPGQLSGGQLQRAGIARAMAPRPKLIVLDEALSNLDRLLQVQVLDLLREMRAAEGTAFLLITHDLALVRYFCQRVLVMADGRLVEDLPVTAQLRFTHPAGVQLQAAVLPMGPLRDPSPARPAPTVIEH